MVDTSDTYIKMCEQAEEIQEYSRNGFGLTQLFILPKNIDVLTINQRQYSGIYSTYSWALDHSGNYWLIPPTKNPCIWLPRQDQLQEMVKGRTFGSYAELLRWFSSHIDTMFQQLAPLDEKNTISPEQLWLAFVMKEKYGKVWLDGDWVKEGVVVGG